MVKVGATSRGAASSGEERAGYYLDLSQSNTIYGASNTVTPLSESCLLILKY